MFIALFTFARASITNSASQKLGDEASPINDTRCHNGPRREGRGGRTLYAASSLALHGRHSVTCVARGKAPTASCLPMHVAKLNTLIIMSYPLCNRAALETVYAPCSSVVTV